MWGSIVFYLTFVCGILVTYQEEGVNTDKLVCNHSKGSTAQEPIVGVSKLGLGHQGHYGQYGIVRHSGTRKFQNPQFS